MNGTTGEIVTRPQDAFSNKQTKSIKPADQIHLKQKDRRGDVVDIF